MQRLLLNCCAIEFIKRDMSVEYQATFFLSHLSLKRLVISFLVDSSRIILNLESSKHSHSTSGCVDYEWVDPCVLDVPTCFRTPTTLDDFLANASILKLDASSDMVVADNCSHSDQVCHGWENASQDFFSLYILTFFNDLHVTLLFYDFMMGFFRSSMSPLLNCTQIRGQLSKPLGQFVTFLG